MTDLTRPFTLTRWEVALASAEEYLRSLWWILVPIPAFGFVAFLMGPNDLIKGLGAICLIWPLTLPLRAVTASARAGSVYGSSTVLAEDDEWLYLKNAQGKGARLARSDVWQVRLARGIWRVKTRRLSLIFIPATSLIEDFTNLNSVLKPNS